MLIRKGMFFLFFNNSFIQFLQEKTGVTYIVIATYFFKNYSGRDKYKCKERYMYLKELDDCAVYIK